jgi:hypothetical protein
VDLTKHKHINPCDLIYFHYFNTYPSSPFITAAVKLLDSSCLSSSSLIYKKLTYDRIYIHPSYALLTMWLQKKTQEKRRDYINKYSVMPHCCTGLAGAP